MSFFRRAEKEKPIQTLSERELYNQWFKAMSLQVTFVSANLPDVLQSCRCHRVEVVQRNAQDGRLIHDLVLFKYDAIRMSKTDMVPSGKILDVVTWNIVFEVE